MKRAFILLLLLQGSLAAFPKVVNRWIDEFSLTNDSYRVALPADARSHIIEICASINDNRDTHGEGDKSWTATLKADDSHDCDITVSWGNTDYQSAGDERYLQVDINGEKRRFTTGVNVYNGDNTLVIEAREDGRIDVFVGSDLPAYAGSLNYGHRISTLTLSARGTLDVAVIGIESEMPDTSMGPLTPRELKAIVTDSESDSPTGIWNYLDRDNNAAYARPGGEYQLAIIADPDKEGNYIIIYMSGARVNSSQWDSGMVKGRLYPTPFAGRYRLEWYDADGRLVDSECNATLEGNLITFNFPLLKTQLRYSR